MTLDSLRLILGGTFDPIHNGHLALATSAAEHFQSPVWLLPNGSPRHRAGPQLPAEQRATLIERAISACPMLKLDRRELSDDLSGFSAETLHALRSELGQDQPIGWLLGADAYAGLHRWHGWQHLGELAHWIIVSRPGTDLGAVDSELANWAGARWVDDVHVLKQRPAGCLYRLPFTPRGESSSAIRQRLAQGDQCRDQLPAAVADYIAAHGLYRSGAPAG